MSGSWGTGGAAPQISPLSPLSGGTLYSRISGAEPLDVERRKGASDGWREGESGNMAVVTGQGHEIHCKD